MFERPEHFHTLLVGLDGRFLGVGDDGELADFAAADDGVVWHRRTGEVHHAVTGRSLPVDGTRVVANGGAYEVSHGPEMLPSEYLRIFEENGWGVPDLRPVGRNRRRSAQGRVHRPVRGSETRSITHRDRPNTSRWRKRPEPVSLWLIREYMGTPDISMAHAPAMAVLSKDDGKRPVQGWHSDYPYHWGVSGAGPGAGCSRVRPGSACNATSACPTSPRWAVRRPSN